MSVRERKHQVRDISVRLFRDGKGEKLLFLHGETGLPGWIPFFEALASRFDVLVPEHPGFGLSDNPPWIRNVADLALYYLDLIEALGAEKVHVVGHSLGGWTAAEMATRNCTQFNSLSLISPAGVRVKGLPAGDNFIWSPEETARNLFHDQTLADQRLARTPSEAEVYLQLTNRFAAAKFGWDPRWYSPALERWLHRIKVPTLVIWGRDDKFLPSAYGKVWSERVPGARLDIIAECGHLPHVEKADVTAEKILGFLGGR